MPKKITTKKVAKSTTKVASKKAAKKTVKKATTKTVTKKVTKQSAKKVKALVCAADSQCFWTTDGHVLQNLEELKLAFGTMDDAVFLHHVTEEKNDFADWVEQVLGDPDCAAALRKAKKPKSAETTVVKCLRYYSA